MKNVFKNFAFIGLLISALFISSCQEEFEELPDSEEQSTITASSSTAKLITDASANDGSYDNIVDGASCLAVQFPYSVLVNGLELRIDSIEDLKLIETIFDQLEDDSDLLTIVFPIKITLSDYTEIEISNAAALEELAKDCIENGADDDIECIDFVYPLTFFTYDTNSQQTGSVAVESDKELRFFFKDLGDNDVVSLNFPVSLKSYDETIITVNSTEALALALNNAKDSCDEDDDDDYNDDDFSKEELDAYLIDCGFLVKEVKRYNQYQTEQYFSYTMNFKADGTVKVYSSLGNLFEGTWSTSANDDGVLLNLEIYELVDFSLEWSVYELEAGRIKLFESDGDRIILKKDCDVPEGNSNEELEVVLEQCKWKFAVPSSSSIGLYTIKFLENGAVKFVDDNGEFFEIDTYATWAIVNNSIVFYNINQELIAERWKITGSSNAQLSVEIYNENELIYENVLLRDCEDLSTVCEEAYIYDVIQSCRWTITNLDGTFFDALDIDFSNENIHVYNANEEVVEEGNWEISGAVLKFNDLSMALANYVGEWTVIACADNLFKIQRGEEILLLTKTCN